MLDPSKVPVVDAGTVNLLIALPCYGGTTFVQHNRSLRWLIEVLRGYGIRHTIQETTTESLIPRARNLFGNMVAFDHDASGQFYTHVLFLDVDIGFNAPDIASLIGWDKDIVALPYPCKDINWNYIVDAVRAGVEDPNVLCRMGSRPIINTNGTQVQFNVTEPVQFSQLGTGILLIKRHVLQKFAEDESRRYKLMASEKYNDREFAYDFFRSGVNDETRYYDSEDYRFCLDARKLGFETWLLPWAITTHTGPYQFVMDIPAQSVFGIPKMSCPQPKGFSPLTIAV